MARSRANSRGIPSGADAASTGVAMNRKRTNLKRMADRIYTKAGRSGNRSAKFLSRHLSQSTEAYSRPSFVLRDALRSCFFANFRAARYFVRFPLRPLLLLRYLYGRATASCLHRVPARFSSESPVHLAIVQAFTDRLI